MKTFRHTDARSLSNVTELLLKYGDKAQLLAGGTDLLGILKTRITPNYPELLINIKRIPHLNHIAEGNRGLSIGALSTLADMADAPKIQKGYPMLAEAARSVAMPQIRYMGTLGGNLAQETRCWYYRYPNEIGGRIMCKRKGKGACLAVKGDNRYHGLFGGKGCFAVCPSDTAVALAALDGKMEIAGPDGKRSIPVERFYHPLGNALAPGEMITRVEIPKPPSGSRQVFIKHRVRQSIDFAVVSVGVAAVMEKGICSSVKIVLGAVAPGPYRAVKAEKMLKGKVPDDEAAAAAAEAAVSGARPLSQNAYKIEIAKALVKKALLAVNTFGIKPSMDANEGKKQE